jgi:hypothetical protein
LRCKRRRLSVARNLSTTLAQEHEVGVKCNTHLMPLEPGAHFGMFVGGVIVEDRVDKFAGRDRRFDPV